MANGMLAVPVDGRRFVAWNDEPIQVSVSAEGFKPFDYTIADYPDGGAVQFRLDPVVLQGRITTQDGRPLPGALVELGDVSDRTDNEGRYALDRATPGTMMLSRPAWQTKQIEWDGGFDALDIAMEQLEINAMRVSARDVSDVSTWERILDLADSTAINALVVDLKAEDGTVVYRSELPVAAAIGAVNSFFDAEDVIADAQARDLYLIGRIGVFQDSFYAVAEPDHAVRTSSGELWRSGNGYAWLDPSDPAAYEYSIALAEEVCSLGFDEIQFDYVSWPIGNLDDAVFDGEYNEEIRVAGVTAFLNRAYSVLHPRCAVSATLFGIVLESPPAKDSDAGVGQLPSAMSRAVDVLSPTLYTTNYRDGWKGMDDPDDYAVEVVITALAGGTPKLDGFAYFRPWLQTWAISEADQRAVQSAVTDEGMGWLLWSNDASYTTAILPPR